MQATSWWEERIIGGAVVVLGLPAPGQPLARRRWPRTSSTSGCGRYDGDAEPLLREFAAAADREADGHKGARWSYRRDFGRRAAAGDRLPLRADPRQRRPLDGVRRPSSPGSRSRLAGDYDHLLIGTSLPWLLPRALHDLESWDERLAAGARGRAAGPASPRRCAAAADLEHWAAFRASFDRLADLFAQVGRGDHAGPDGRPPATICVLSGDVHHAYAAQAHYREPLDVARSTS